ncbi:restriction endonuclease subunit S [Clostridium botulinum]|uniref:restriction endonuclease subunit S n=1 Tax=Clostridium botulinum TaxID=1491 RepID=UPI0004D68DAE|nr:restriction endonuclease subunit S [Clostridium botulinum]KEI00081.1 hypothetical protein Z952_13935 [Clostridium botulinum C/D str. BKT75002]KEI05932.1 hypothetical protein Z954_14410 [Clostridium botulinum C/D str. BKT2873]MCD3351838.1 restriction endonuclease subunit S [Clostridium botulinum D/C]MCD3360803.1 restriction endonuclease subunit S [Clostridium botulinum D/C]MCD3362610.1 restriction endonuclease subunit S [Clostridium botulinum D/C]
MKYTLEDIFKFIRNGANIKQGVIDGGYPITRIETISNSYIDTNKVGYAGIYELGKFKDYLLKGGDILISHINSEKHLGKTAIYEDINKDIIHGMNLLCLRPDTDKIIPKYINYYFNTKYFKNKLPKITKKSVNQASFSVNDFKKLSVDISNLETQQKIVNILDKAQSLIDKRKAQIEALDELVKSRFVEMFGDPITNSRMWKTQLLENVCEMKAGKSIKAANIHEKNLTGLYPCYGGNGLRGYVKEYSHEGDIPLIGRQGALCGNVKYARGKFYATEHAVVTKPKIEMNNYWLYFVLMKLNLNRFSTGAAQPGLTVGKLNKVEFPMVPIHLQNQFADFVTKVDKLKLKMQNSLKKLEDNFNSLMQKAFKGELFKD